MTSSSSTPLDSNEALRQEWMLFGRPGGYEAPSEKELRDLANRRHRKRGEQEQRKRLKRNRQQLEREQERERATELGGQSLDPSFDPRREPLPTYLLDRGAAPESPALQLAAADESDDSSGEFNGDWITREDARWATEQKERRAREAIEWDAQHGAERETQWAQLREDRADFYWAHLHTINGKQIWQLRKGGCLDDDATAIMSESEPFLKYRAFRAFTGDLLKAQKVFIEDAVAWDEAKLSRSEWLDLRNWLDSERATFTQPAAAAPLPSPSRCCECGECECVCPCSTCHRQQCVCAPSDAEGDAVLELPDVYGDSSADCHYDGTAVHAQLEADERYQRVVNVLLEKGMRGPIRVRADPTSTDLSDRHELECERVNEEHGRISNIHGRPWHEIPPGATAPVHWLDFVDRPWEQEERERARLEELEHHERLERMARANIPPPYREDTCYGPLASNTTGDDAFRKDRAVWYEHVTGESLDGLSLTAQWERVDVIARRFRDYNDGRAPRQIVGMADVPPAPRPV